jgi:outer membrane biosynthesis protein TonB
MAHDVFISHSNKDKVIADATCAWLESCNIRCWIAPRDVPLGANWGASILKAIRGARVMVLIFSAHANSSPQIQREVERAVSSGVTVIPMRIENVAPQDDLEFFLGAPHWLDAFTPPLERHLEHLVSAIHALLQVPAAPHSAGPKPEPTTPVRERHEPEPTHELLGPEPISPVAETVHEAEQQPSPEPEWTPPPPQTDVEWTPPPPEMEPQAASKSIAPEPEPLPPLPDTPAPIPAPQAKPKRKSRAIGAVLVVLLFIAAIAAGVWWLNARNQPLADAYLPPSTETVASPSPDSSAPPAPATTDTQTSDTSSAQASPISPNTPLDELQRRAQNGEIAAQSELGDRYYVGRDGVAADKALAFSWYKKAADQGDAEAEYRIGFMYNTNTGIQGDKAQAFSWYRRAADQGNANGEFETANCYEHGIGTDQDYSQAMFWYQKAAAHGDDYALTCVGRIYEKGEGVDIDTAKAVEWYRKAAAKNESNAITALKRLGYSVTP